MREQVVILSQLKDHSYDKKMAYFEYFLRYLPCVNTYDEVIPIAFPLNLPRDLNQLFLYVLSTNTTASPWKHMLRQ